MTTDIVISFLLGAIVGFAIGVVHTLIAILKAIYETLKENGVEPQ